jgi:hypothetical protein
VPSNTLEDLRSKLFETIDALKNPDNPMSIERAKAISEVASQIISSAKVEVEYLNVTDQNDARLPVMEPKSAEEPGKLPAGVHGLHTHRLK